MTAPEPVGGRGRERRTGQREARTALVVLVLGVLAVGALLLRPGTGPFVRGRGPIGHNGGITVLVALAWAGAALALCSRHRERLSRTDVHAGGAEYRLADVVRRTLLLAPFVLPVLLLLLHRFSPTAIHHSDVRPPPPRLTGLPVPSSTPPPTREPHHAHVNLPGWLATALSALGIALVLAGLAYVAWYLWRLLYRPAPDTYAATYSATDAEREALAQAVEYGRRALLDGDDARTAVIACYAAMEEALARSGIARLASDSPTDLLERAGASGLSSKGPATELTALFREARYSSHPMDDGHRQRAAAALTRIAGELDAPAAAVEAAP